MNPKEFSYHNKIKYYDGVMNPMEVRMLREKITYTPMTWTGKDDKGLPTNTLTKDFNKDDPIFTRCQNLAFEIEPKLKHLQFVVSGINFIMPQLNPSYFHKDGKNIITGIFYITPKTTPDDGGETQFDLGDILLGVKPIPGRFCIFDGSISHRTSYFRDKDRITIYLKYIKDPLYNIFNE